MGKEMRMEVVNELGIQVRMEMEMEVGKPVGQEGLKLDEFT